MAQAEKKETSIVTVKDVIYVYSSVSVPKSQKNDDKKPPTSAPSSPTFGLEFHSYEIKIIISEEKYKKLKKVYKGAKNFANADELTGEEVLEKFEGVNEADVTEDMVVIKFAQTALVGKPDKQGVRRESRPVSQIGIKGRVQDMNGLTIDQDTNLGNGTKGHFQFRPVDSKFGLYLYPQLICVTDLVEYAGGAVEEDFDSLGLEDLDDTDMAVEAVAAVEEDQPTEEYTDADEEIETMF
jgi:hypothetical protein